MQQGQSLYILQAELIDKKVEISVNSGFAAIEKAISGLRQDLCHEINALGVELRQEMKVFGNELRQEMSDFKSEMRQEMSDFKSEMRQEMSAFKSEIQHEMRAFKSGMQQEMTSFKAEIRQEINKLREELSEMRLNFGNRLTAVETILGLRQKKQDNIRNHFLDFGFKFGWVVMLAILSMGFSFLGGYLHTLFN